MQKGTAEGAMYSPLPPTPSHSLSEPIVVGSVDLVHEAVRVDKHEGEGEQVGAGEGELEACLADREGEGEGWLGRRGRCIRCKKVKMGIQVMWWLMAAGRKTKCLNNESHQTGYTSACMCILMSEYIRACVCACTCACICVSFPFTQLCSFTFTSENSSLSTRHTTDSSLRAHWHGCLKLGLTPSV